jgi:hypothetical protein
MGTRCDAPVPTLALTTEISKTSEPRHTPSQNKTWGMTEAIKSEH